MFNTTDDDDNEKFSNIDRNSISSVIIMHYITLSFVNLCLLKMQFNNLETPCAYSVSISDFAHIWQPFIVLWFDWYS